MVMLLLAGCGAAETVETVADVWEEPVMAAPSQIHLELPGEALECAMESDTGRLYLGDGYDVMVQTLSGGDLEATIRALTGFSKEEITHALQNLRQGAADRRKILPLLRRSCRADRCQRRNSCIYHPAG